MTQHNLTQILKVIRDLVMRNRPCYRDYLGKETVTKTAQIGAGTFEDNDGFALAQFPATDPSFTGFILGETYTVILDGVTADYVACNLSPISEETGPVIGTATAYNTDNTFDGWLAAVSNPPGGLACFVQTFDTSFAGKTISISQTKTETAKRYKTKLLPEYLLPAFLRKNVVATKTEVQSAAAKATAAADAASTAQSTANTAQTTANAAQTTANAAQSTARAAQSTANTAKSTADTAKTTADAVSLKTANQASGRFYRTYSANNGFNASENAVILYAGNSDIVSGKSISGIRLVAEGSAIDIRSSLLMYVQEPRRETAVTLRFSGSGAYAARILKGVELADISSIILKSSTANSTKQFRITVDDTGTLKATEATEVT